MSYAEFERRAKELVGRRVDDGHCGAHQKNTEDLESLNTKTTEIKTSFNTAKWIVGILVPIATLVITLFLSIISYNINQVVTSVAKIEQMVQSSNLSIATFRVEIDNIKKDVTEMKIELDKKNHTR